MLDMRLKQPDLSKQSPSAPVEELRHRMPSASLFEFGNQISGAHRLQRQQIGFYLTAQNQILDPGAGLSKILNIEVSNHEVGMKETDLFAPTCYPISNYCSCHQFHEGSINH